MNNDCVIDHICCTVYTQFSQLYQVSKNKRAAFERLLLHEYIKNDILQYLIE